MVARHGQVSAALLLPCWLGQVDPDLGKSGLDMTAKRQAQALRLDVVFALALSAAGCASSAIDKIPSWAGGEPEGTPPRLASEMEYPPVHDRPPKPTTKVVTVEEQAKIEKELAAARDAQAKRAEQIKKDRAIMLANQPKVSPRPAPEDAPSY